MTIPPGLAVAATSTVVPMASLAVQAMANLLNPFTAADATNNSLTSFGKTGRISSRVYIDGSIAQDPVITDILKTVHTQYCGFILTALQMNQFVSEGVTVQSLLKVVATEDMKPHEDIAGAFMSADDAQRQKERAEDKLRDAVNKQMDRDQKQRELDQKDRHHADTHAVNVGKLFQAKQELGIKGQIVSLAGDNHIPAGKMLEVTLVNPNNPNHKVTLNILVQLAPYLVPEDLAVQFIVKDQQPSFYQRWIQWRTGEISFWKDFVFQSDIVAHREKLLKLDPSGTFADMMKNQSSSTMKTIRNAGTETNQRSRNIANAVLIFNQDTVTRAKAVSGVDLNDYKSRQAYFEATYAMIIVVVDQMYNQVTFYYNGIEDTGTFSFDQMRVSSKGGSNSMDLVSVMNALNQGKSPKF